MEFFQTTETFWSESCNHLFSLNFDEINVLEKSQLDINVSYLEGCEVRRQNLSTVSLEGGTSLLQLMVVQQ